MVGDAGREQAVRALRRLPCRASSTKAFRSTTGSKVMDCRSSSDTGVTDSSDVFYERGYVAALQPKHRLVLIDARGHGSAGSASAYAAEPGKEAPIITALRTGPDEMIKLWGERVTPPLASACGLMMRPH